MLSADHHHVQQKQSHRLCEFDQIMKKSLLILKILEKSFTSRQNCKAWFKSLNI